MALFRPLCSSEVTSSTPFEASLLQSAKQLLVGRLALDIRHLDDQDLSKAVLADRTNDQDALADDPGADPDLLVASVHKEVGVGVGFQRALPPLLELRVERRG